MIIPLKSDVLILGIDPLSLAFACILGTNGLKVLVIDDVEKPHLSSEILGLSTYNIQLLKHIGFNIEANTSQLEFVNQSLKLLATNLCSVIWETSIDKRNGNQLTIKQAEELHPHDSHFIYETDDLIIDKKNNDLNFRNAFLLAWRLIGIENQTLFPEILKSFQKEKEILGEYKSSKSRLQKIREKLMANKKAEIHLADSPINLHLSHKRALAAGDILPDLPFYDEQLKAESSLYSWCKYQHFSMIIFGYLGPTNLFSVARYLQLNYPVQLFYLPPSKKNEALFNALDIPIGEKKTLIVRPDRYLSFVNDTVDLDIIDNYLKNVLLMRAKAEEKVI